MDKQVQELIEKWEKGLKILRDSNTEGAGSLINIHLTAKIELLKECISDLKSLPDPIDLLFTGKYNCECGEKSTGNMRFYLCNVCGKEVKPQTELTIIYPEKLGDNSMNISRREGWNDCIDEMKRLNQQPEFQSPKLTEERPKIVCLCGSTRFSKAFQDAQLKETLAGKIVLTIGCNMKTDTEIFGSLPESELIEIKSRLDELHKRKIDLADEVMILDVDGYIGSSTQSELDYARAHNKIIRYLSQPT